MLLQDKSPVESFQTVQPLVDVPAPQDIIHATYDIQRITLDVFGRTKSHCSGASMLLAYALRQRGYDARCRAGKTIFLNGSEIGWGHHCWVQCENYRLDPTVDQFTGREHEALVSDHDILLPWYYIKGNGGDWGALKPAVVPDKAACLRQIAREQRFYGRDGKAVKRWLRLALNL
jgi:hypothetical protein